MKKATDELEADKAEDAAKNQDRAIEQLEQAQEELEKALQQLRKEEREETLRDLESRFRKMLAEQTAINEGTVVLHAIGQDHFQRAEELQTADLSLRERRLSEEAAKCVHILYEEGSTIVFPRIIDQLAKDMGNVADRLGQLNVGPITQRIEREIVDTLEQLLDAVKRMQEENEQQQAAQGGGKQDKEPPLLPPSAELKLLRSSQVRVNDRTETIEQARSDQSESKEWIEESLKTTAERQNACAKVAKEMRDRDSGS